MITYPDLIKFVRRSLGEPIIQVEIDDTQIRQCADSALQVLGTYRPAEKRGFVDLLPTTQKYHLTKEQIGKGIIEVFKPSLLRTPVSLDQFDVFKYHANLPNLDPGDFIAEQVWWNQVRAVAGSDDDWDLVIDPETGEGDLFVTPVPAQAMKLWYIYVTDPSITSLSPSDETWLKNYTLGLSKMVLGHIRRKFGTVKGSESTIEMDGQALIDEGKEKCAELEGYVNNRGAMVPPIRG